MDSCSSDKKTDQVKDHKISPLLTLPPELREMIYKDLLSPEATAEDSHHYRPYNEDPGCRFRSWLWPGSNAIYPAILRTNKQLYNETISYLYKSMDCEIRVYRADRGCWPRWHGRVDHEFFPRQPDGVSARFVQWYRRPCSSEDFPTHAKDPTHSWNVGEMLNTRCLNFVCNITLAFQWSEVFGQEANTLYDSTIQHRFTSSGELVLQALRCIDRKPMRGGQGSNKLRLIVDGGDGLQSFVAGLEIWNLSAPQQQAIPMDSRVRGLYAGLLEIIRLLRRINQRMEVSMFEYPGKRTFLKKKVEGKEVDWDMFPWTQD